MRSLNVAIIGTKFMGKVHSHAWRNAPRFFDMGIRPVLKVAVGAGLAGARQLAETWGWEEASADWRSVMARPDIDIIDISAPPYLHREMAVAAAETGKHIFLEKPMALSAAEAKEMVAAAERAGVTHYVNHNYRRAPAVRLARRLIDEGFVGRIYHWRSAYLQDWIVDPGFPLTWHLRAETAGYGAHGDLGSHSVDLARYLVGDIAAVTGMMATFIGERPLPGEGAATFSAGSGGATGVGKVTVDDASFFTAQFTGGALGSFELSRFAPGRKNYNQFEIYGSEGSLAFNLERLNELQVFSRRDPAHAQGFRTILATETNEHDYIANWWPPGHIIGYEHAFLHAVVDFMRAIETGAPIRPDFNDGLAAALVLDAAAESARTGQRITL